MSTGTAAAIGEVSTGTSAPFEAVSVNATAVPIEDATIEGSWIEGLSNKGSPIEDLPGGGVRFDREGFDRRDRRLDQLLLVLPSDPGLRLFGFGRCR